MDLIIDSVKDMGYWKCFLLELHLFFPFNNFTAGSQNTQNVHLKILISYCHCIQVKILLQILIVLSLIINWYSRASVISRIWFLCSTASMAFQHFFKKAKIILSFLGLPPCYPSLQCYCLPLLISLNSSDHGGPGQMIN